MNSLHDAVQSRNGPAEAAAYGERNGDVGLALLCRVGYGRRRRTLSQTVTAALAPTNFVTLPVGRTEIYSKKLHLFIT